MQKISRRTEFLNGKGRRVLRALTFPCNEDQRFKQQLRRERERSKQQTAVEREE